MTTTPPLEREQIAARLLRTAAKHALDPDVEIDWDAPPAPDLYWMPPHRSSLWGTALWDGLSVDQRIELTKHELCSVASVGIWFENILMQMLLRQLYDRSQIDRHARHTLTEIAEECRHSMMFARMISQLGCPDYGPGRRAHELGRMFKSWSTTSLTFAATLYVEEVLDAFQRELMADEAVQPLPRAVSRLHVVEEARHIQFARNELRIVYPTLGRAARAHSRFVFAIVANVATVNLVHPAAYAAVGIEPAVGAAAAAANPHWRATKRFLADRVLTFLDEQGLISEPGRRLFLRPAGVL
jgi:hypothetical protein